VEQDGARRRGPALEGLERERQGRDHDDARHHLAGLERVRHRAGHVRPAFGLVEQAGVEHGGDGAEQDRRGPGQAEEEPGGQGHGGDGREREGGAEQHAGHEREAQQVERGPGRAGVEERRQEQLEGELGVQTCRRQPRDEGGRHPSAEEDERVGHGRDAAEGQDRPDRGQEKGDELEARHRRMAKGATRGAGAARVGRMDRARITSSTRRITPAGRNPETGSGSGPRPESTPA